MDRPKLTHEARCLIIVAGTVLEGCIEDRAEELAASRSAAEITPEDVENAAKQFFDEGLSDLPALVEQAIDRYKRRSTKAA